MITKFKKYKKGKKDFWQSFLRFIILSGLVLGLISFLVISNWRVNRKRAELLLKLESLQEEVQLLEERNNELQEGMDQVNQDEYWEEKIREQGYKKEGEEAIVVKKEMEEEKPEAEQGFWERLLGKFKRD